jgi:lipoate synthase
MNASEVWSRWQALVFCIGLICTDSSRYCQLKIVMRVGVMTVDEIEHMKHWNVNTVSAAADA